MQRERPAGGFKAGYHRSKRDPPQVFPAKKKQFNWLRVQAKKRNCWLRVRAKMKKLS